MTSMMWLALAVVILTFVAVMLVAGNNLSVCVGPAVGSRIISKRFGMLLGAVGFTVGLLIQGAGMTKAVSVLLPTISMQLRAEALLVAILIFVIADLMRTPLSFTMTLVGLIAGFSMAAGLMTKTLYLAEVVSMWVAAP